MRDLMALAPTGSGKSCAFLLPMISLLMNMPPVIGEVALLIAAVILLRTMPKGITGRFFKGKL